MNNRQAGRIGRRAFTIIEVMIVLVIIGLIGSIVAINLVGAANEARKRTTTESLRQVQAALQMYHGSHGMYPTSAGDLSVLIQQNILQLQKVPLDAWSTPIELYSDGVQYMIRSLGPDRAPDTADDLTLEPDHQ